MKKIFGWLAVAIVVIGAVLWGLSQWYIPYYIEKPVPAENTLTVITPSETKDSDIANKGQFMMTAVGYEQATPLTYFAQFLPHHKIVSEKELLGNVTDLEAYNMSQTLAMQESILKAKIVAFDHLELPYTMYYYGITVMEMLESSGVAGKLKVGDVITHIDGIEFQDTTEFWQKVQTKAIGETFVLTVYRDKETQNIEVSRTMSDWQSYNGLAVYAIDDLEMETESQYDVAFDAENIGGPSAGLMFTLTVYDSLTEGDLTKGHKIAGTGTMSYDGYVGPIGGIEKKVVGAKDAGAEIFFAPDFEITYELLPYYPDSKNDYQMAVEFAEKENIDITIVPIRTFADAVDYLSKLEQK